MMQHLCASLYTTPFSTDAGGTVADTSLSDTFFLDGRLTEKFASFVRNTESPLWLVWMLPPIAGHRFQLCWCCQLNHLLFFVT